MQVHRVGRSLKGGQQALPTLACRWEEQTAALVEQHDKAVEEVKAGFELRIQENERRHAALQEVSCGRSIISPGGWVNKK